MVKSRRRKGRSQRPRQLSGLLYIRSNLAYARRSSVTEQNEIEE